MFTVKCAVYRKAGQTDSGNKFSNRLWNTGSERKRKYAEEGRHCTG